MKQKFSKTSTPQLECRINDEIVGVKECRVSSEGVPSQVMPFSDALSLAESMNMDLVEVNGKITPPIMRIVPYDKYLYEQKKKAKQNKQQVTQLKEIQLKVNIADNDLNVKTKKAAEFLKEGNKVKVVLTIKGRELLRREESKKAIYKFITLLEGIGAPESMPKDEGNRVTCIMKPNKK